jgi:EAL domain-containing protein (putative c-di-GMP-specific phosphodiesterase class I)
LYEQDSVDEDILMASREIPQLLSELRQAIERNELTLFYQPKFHAHTTAVVGVEALLRWRHPDRGLLRPDDFLPLVREHGLMGRVTDLVVNMALDDALQWHTAGVDVPVAVNLFPPLLSDIDLPDKLCHALSDRGLEVSALAVEITEDLFVDDMDTTKMVLNELVERGISIALDDFGTGYSALSYLSDLPIDEVKLDRDFVARAIVDERAAMVVGAIIDLAHKLGLVIVAEGIDNAESAARLRDLDCDVLQGYYLSRPLPADEVVGALTAATRPTY